VSTKTFVDLAGSTEGIRLLDEAPAGFVGIFGL